MVMCYPLKHHINPLKQNIMQQIGIVKKITDAAVKDYTKADGTQSTIKYRSLIVSLFG